MYPEDDLLPISSLQHLLFCERQWALIYLEGIWDENRLTVEGSQMHERVHEAESESRPGVRIARGLRVRSLRLGLTGQCDVVEFRRCVNQGDTKDTEDCKVKRSTEDFGVNSEEPDRGDTGDTGKRNSECTIGNISKEIQWGIPFPIEYKRGKPKRDRCDEVQLCAQAMCLEEMLEVDVPAGAIFYGRTRRRHDVAFDAALREETERAATRLHELFDAGVTPPARYEKKCDNCSLIHACMPKATGGTRSAVRYLAQAVAGCSEEREVP